jgi:hypothetical protein
MTLTLTAVLALGAGCGGEDRASGDDPSPSTSAATSTPPESAGSESPQAEPATGKVVETKWFRVKVPAGWRVTEVATDFVIVADDRTGPSIISFSITDTYGEPSPLGKLARTLADTAHFTGDYQVSTDGTLGGEPAYVITGARDGATLEATAYGSLHDEQDVSVTFSLDDTVGPRQELVDSVLATWQWK